ncbi:MAG: hypothetical protein IT385_02305 [Deltaproteobacteria bacterium]|nr:hypothetical protein [Deltaproteobacteria bacterium]
MNDTAVCAIGGDSHVHCWDDGLLTSGAPFGDRKALDGFVEDVRHDAAASFDDLVARVGPPSGFRPHRYGPFDHPVQLVVGEGHACVLEESGAVACWGGVNLGGQIGDGTTVARHAPARPVGLPAVRAMTAGRWHTCGTTCDGDVFCWGQVDDGPYETRPKLLEALPGEALSVAAGRSHTCAVMANGTAFCWGEIGGEGWSASSAPAQVLGVSGIVELSGGDSFGCARLATGEVWCFGRERSDGVLGQGKWVPGERTVRIDGISDAVALSSRDRFTCALERSGDLVCWGSLAPGFSYGGTHSTPRRITASDIPQSALLPPPDFEGAELLPESLPPMEEVAVGWGNVCGFAERAMYCWGHRRGGRWIGHVFAVP